MDGGKKIPKGIATLVSILIILMFMAGIGSLFGLQISEFANDFTLIKAITMAVKDLLLETKQAGSF